MLREDQIKVFRKNRIGMIWLLVIVLAASFAMPVASYASEATYTVTFDKNKDDATYLGANVKLVPAGEKLGEFPAPPDHDDYAVTSWNSFDDGMGSPITEDTVITSDLTVYAQWERQYRVTFIPDATDPGFLGTVSVYVVSGSSIGASMPEEPTDGFKSFVSWNTAADGTGTTVEAATIINAPVTAYAIWTDEPTLQITIHPSISGGTISTEYAAVPVGYHVTVTVDPDLGKQLDLDSLHYNDGSNVPIIQQNGQFSFNMPDHDVTISGTFNSPADWTDVIGSNDEFCENLVQADDGTIYGIHISDYIYSVQKKSNGVWTDISWTLPSNAPIQFISDLALDSQGNLYAIDSYEELIRKYEGGNWTSIPAAGLSNADDLIVDTDGTLYIIVGQLVKKYDGTTWMTLGSDGEFLSASDLAMDSDGNLYCLESSYLRQIMKYTGSEWVSFASTPSVEGYGKLCIDSEDNFYLTGMDNGQKIMTYRDGSWVQIKTQGEFARIYDLFISNDDKFYVSDYVVKQNRVAQGVSKVTYNTNYTGASDVITPAYITVNNNLGTLPQQSRNGYTLAGWNTSANGTGTNYTGMTPITGDVTLYAKWTAVSNGDSGGNGGSGTPSPSAPEINGSKDGKGNATVEIISDAAKDAKTASVTFAKEDMTDVDGTKTTAMTVKTPVANITFDSKAIDAIAKEAGSEVKITASKVSVDSLSDKAKSLIGDRPVYNFEVTSGDKTITKFGGNVQVSIPYTPKAGEKTKAIVIYYINEQGNPEPVKNCRYDEKTGMITFTTNHFSKYAVGYNDVNFSDVNADAWYADAVEFLAARGIATGTGADSFSPNSNLTRGQFLVMVMRAYGIAADETAKDNFADAGNTYYTEYLATAKSLGIADGIGNNLFAPEKEITRQEMFTLLYKTLAQIGELPTGDSGKDLTAFSDGDKVAAWATDAVTLLTETGTITGNDGKLRLTETTTRAQMSQVLYNLLSK